MAELGAPTVAFRTMDRVRAALLISERTDSSRHRRSDVRHGSELTQTLKDHPRWTHGSRSPSLSATVPTSA